jgi:hypothetical protein
LEQETRLGNFNDQRIPPGDVIKGMITLLTVPLPEIKIISAVKEMEFACSVQL